MATKSIYKSVNIKSSRKCASLFAALERSKRYSVAEDPAPLEKSCATMTREQMKAIWGEKS